MVVPIKGYEDRYLISDEGKVFSLVNNKGRQREFPLQKKPSLSHNGYLFVSLSKEGIRKRVSIHRLVLEHFVPNPLSLPQCNHKNEVKTDNRVSNLEWCTEKYNANYGSRNERMVRNLRNDIRRSFTVLQMSLSGEIINEYPSFHEAARELNLNEGNISNCCSGRCHSYGGYKWKIKKKCVSR